MVNILDILTPDELFYKPSLEECLKKQKVWTRYIRLLTRMYDKAVQMDNELAVRCHGMKNGRMLHTC